MLSTSATDVGGCPRLVRKSVRNGTTNVPKRFTNQPPTSTQYARGSERNSERRLSVGADRMSREGMRNERGLCTSKRQKDLGECMGLPVTFRGIGAGMRKLARLLLEA